MASQKSKITGALALTEPTEDDMGEYNAEMGKLKDQLVQSPEEISKARMLAWAGGLAGDNGASIDLSGGVVNAAKSMSAYDLKDRELRAQYIPSIMNALSAQQQTKQLARLGGMGSSGPMQLIGMDPNFLPQYAQVTGQKLSDVTTLWKEANKPDPMQTNTVQRFAKPGGGFDERFVGDPTKGLALDPKTNAVSVMQGAPEANATMAGSQALSTEAAKKFFDTLDGVASDGTPYKQLFIKQFPEVFGRFAQQQNLPVQGAQQGAPAPAPMGGGARPPAPVMQTPPAMVAAAGARPPVQAPPANMMPEPQPGMRGNFQGNPDSIGNAIAGIRDPQERSNAMSAYENQLRGRNPAYIPEGGDMPSNPAVNAPAMGGNPNLPPGAMQTGVDPIRGQQIKNLAEGNTQFQTKVYPSVIALGDQADEKITNLMSAADALRRAGDTGPTTETKAQVANWLGKAGFKNAEDYATNIQNLERGIAEHNFKGLGEQNGVQTEGDATRYAKTYAALGKTKEANEFVFDTARAQADREKMKADYYRKAMPIANKNGGDLMEVERRWANIAPSIRDMPSMRRWVKKWNESNGLQK